MRPTRLYSLIHRGQYTALLALMTCLLASSLAEAQEEPEFFVTKGRYTVHYSLFPSTFLKPEIAQSYAITRGPKLAIMNVSVREALDEHSDRESVAAVTGSINDLIHRTPIDFKEIREQGAVYYLAEIPFTGNPTLYFDLLVQPIGSNTSIPVSFKRRLSAD